MGRGRRRRRERRDAREVREAPVARRESRSVEKRRSDFLAQQRSLGRRRTIVGALGFVPLAGYVGCGSGITALCGIPVEIWLAIWAAFFGSFLGLTIRLVLERRRFARGEAAGKPS
jgi:hypothetical protein